MLSPVKLIPRYAHRARQSSVVVKRKGLRLRSSGEQLLVQQKRLPASRADRRARDRDSRQNAFAQHLERQLLPETLARRRVDRSYSRGRPPRSGWQLRRMEDG